MPNAHVGGDPLRRAPFRPDPNQVQAWCHCSYQSKWMHRSLHEAWLASFVLFADLGIIATPYRCWPRRRWAWGFTRRTFKGNRNPWRWRPPLRAVGFRRVDNGKSCGAWHLTTKAPIHLLPASDTASPAAS